MDRQQAASEVLENFDAFDSLTDAARHLMDLTGDEFNHLEGARGFLRREKSKRDADDGQPDDTGAGRPAPGPVDPQPAQSKSEFDEHKSKGTGQFNFRGTLDKPMTVDELLTAHGVDLKVWEVDRLKINKWGVTSKLRNENANGVVVERLEAAQNYQIAAWLVRRRDKPEVLMAEAAEGIIASVAQAIGSRVGAQQPGTRRGHDVFDPCDGEGARMLEVSIFDLHMGKLAWGAETGFADWDSKVAASAALEAIDDLLTFFPSYERIWLPLGHDFFNSDGPGDGDSGGKTTRGTAQDEDTRWAKSLNTGVDVALAMIERCLQFAPVDITMMRGNHDEQRSVFLGRLLKEVYKDHPHVTIDDGLGMLKPYVWGDNFLATHHGQLESLQKVIAECAIRFPEFGIAKWREIHCGHGHRMKSAGLVIDGVEEQSVRHRMIPSLCSADNYHARNLYHNNPAAECYLWDKKDLYLGHHSHNRSRL